MSTIAPCEQPASVHLLRDGTVVLLRPLEPGETDRVQEVFDQLSQRSRFLRFHVATPRLTGTAVRRLATVLPCERGAVVALAHGRAVGIAHWARYGDDVGVAELAAAVADRHQRRGLGGALVAEAAASASRAGMSRIVALVHPDNRTVLDPLRRAGAVPRPGRDGELIVDAAALVRMIEVRQARRVVRWPGGVRRPGSPAGDPRRP